MIRRKVLTFISLVLAVATLAAGASPAFAATPHHGGTSGGNGLRISPVRSELTIKPGESQTLDVYVENLTSQKANLQGVVNDFTAGKDESGTPYILLNGEKAPTHSLKGYVAAIPNFTLGPKATQHVKVTITIPTGTAGGGYFGAVRFLPQSSSSDKNVNLTASVGSLILVRVPGKIVEQVNVASFDVRRQDAKTHQLGGASSIFTSNKSLHAVVRFNNVGNVQEQPFGKVILKKGSNVLGTYEINNTNPRGNVLPDSIRRFDVPLKGLGSFGKYTIEGNFGYGTKGQLVTAKTTFYIVPLAVIIGAIVLLLVILFLIFGLPRMIRAYNRRVVQRATGKGRR